MANVGLIVGPRLLLAVNTVLEGLPYTANPDTGRIPPVYFEGTFHETADEQIELLGAINNGELDWKDGGPARVDESFTIGIRIRSAVQGKTGPEALARCVELSDVIEAGFRNQTTGQPEGLHEDNVLIVPTYRFVGYETDPFPVDDTGWGYDLELRLRVNARH